VQDQAMPSRNGSGIALLADPTRRRIIQLIAIRPRRPTALAREVGRSKSAISRQLRILRTAGIIREIPILHDRRGALFGLNPEQTGRVVAWLAGTEIGIEAELRATGRKATPPTRLAEEVPASEPDVADSFRDGDWRLNW
jgi:DNA-binding transcriptional ArsR family regulator